ncbi:hypothetical protein H6G27_07000 [Nostoc linckia FACHB-104]|nr:hypothetical protein [Nostoc linckia FACHB-104]
MTAKNHRNNYQKHQQDSKINQLSALKELSDCEAELVVGGWGSGGGSGSGSGGGSGSGSGGGFGIGGWDDPHRTC